MSRRKAREIALQVLFHIDFTGGSPQEIIPAVYAMQEIEFSESVNDYVEWIVAGTLAVKRTHELIPFCHPLPIDGIRFAIDWRGERELEIVCTVTATHRTGVEMEALTGATVAALTVYDMCKALSHAIVLGPAKLVGKRGGKRDVGQVR